MVVPAAISAIFHCDELAALVAKRFVTRPINLLSLARHAIVTETPTFAGV